MGARRRTARAVALLAATACVGAFGLGPTAAAARAPKVPEGPAGGAFYAPPDPLAKAKPGTLIRAQPTDAPEGARAWRVLYHSRSVVGDDIAVSGLIVVPDGAGPKRGRPVVTWAHGTTGLADVCTPSKNPPAVYPSLPAIDKLVAAGYVVVATDYEGLGTPGLHPYLVGASEGHSVLDAARAARAFAPADAGREVVIGGHSQGGHAALFAGELAAGYAPELKVLGVAAVAPAADLDVILTFAARIPAALGFAVMAIEGLHAAYPEADPAAVFTPDAAVTAARLARETLQR